MTAARPGTTACRARSSATASPTRCRNRAATDEYQRVQKLRIACATLLERLPPELKESDEAKLLAQVERGLLLHGHLHRRVRRRLATDRGHLDAVGATSASLLMEQDAKWQGLLGENLAAQHYTKQSGVEGDVFARRFLDEWLKSPPHRDNMAFAGYDHAGVGAAVNGDTVYVAVLFSTDMGLPPPKPEGPASAVTSWVSPAAASAAAPVKPSGNPLRLRGAEGGQ